MGTLKGITGNTGNSGNMGKTRNTIETALFLLLLVLPLFPLLPVLVYLCSQCYLCSHTVPSVTIVSFCMCGHTLLRILKGKQRNYNHRSSHQNFNRLDASHDQPIYLPPCYSSLLLLCIFSYW